MSQIALVTGGNRGIGLAIATALQSSGMDVVVTYRSGNAPAGFKAVKTPMATNRSEMPT